MYCRKNILSGLKKILWVVDKPASTTSLVCALTMQVWAISPFFKPPSSYVFARFAHHNHRHHHHQSSPSLSFSSVMNRVENALSAGNNAFAWICWDSQKEKRSLTHFFPVGCSLFFFYSLAVALVHLFATAIVEQHYLPEDNRGWRSESFGCHWSNYASFVEHCFALGQAPPHVIRQEER